MTIHIKHIVNLRAWEEVEEDNLLYGPANDKQEIVVNNMMHIVSGKLLIADGEDATIPIDDITTVMGMSFRADQDVTITIDGGASIALKRPSAGTDDETTFCNFFIEGSVTELIITKPTTTPAANCNVRYVVWGDPE